MQRFRMISRSGVGTALIAALGLTTLVPGVASAASFPLSFRIVLGTSCVNGLGTEGATVQILWKGGNGTLKASTSRVVANDGTWQLC